MAIKADVKNDMEFGQASLGCAAIALRLFMTMPIWFMLLFGILESIDARPWMWVLFVMYVPSNLLAAILEEVFKKWTRG